MMKVLSTSEHAYKNNSYLLKIKLNFEHFVETKLQMVRDQNVSNETKTAAWPTLPSGDSRMLKSPI
jgi:hypothetical protein